MRGLCSHAYPVLEGRREGFLYSMYSFFVLQQLVWGCFWRERASLPGAGAAPEAGAGPSQGNLFLCMLTNELFGCC